MASLFSKVHNLKIHTWGLNNIGCFKRQHGLICWIGQSPTKVFSLFGSFLVSARIGNIASESGHQVLEARLSGKSREIFSMCRLTSRISEGIFESLTFEELFCKKYFCRSRQKYFLQKMMYTRNGLLSSGGPEALVFYATGPGISGIVYKGPTLFFVMRAF